MAGTLGNVYPNAGTLTPSGGATVNAPVTTGASYVPATATATAGGTGTSSFMSEVQQPDYTSTQFVTNAVYQNLMGRNATKQEIDDYHKKFTAYAATHPIFTRSSSSTGAGSRDITAAKAPLSETDFISNIVRGGSESKEYTAATTYFDAMRAAMGGFRGGY